MADSNQLFEKFQAKLTAGTGLIIKRNEKWHQILTKLTEEDLNAMIASGSFETHSKQWQTVLRILNISETYFYRDPNQLKGIIDTVFTELIEKQPGGHFRVWSAGCSRGEEAFTIAILLNELKLKQYPSMTYEILGTDIQPESIAFARNAIYENYSVRSDLPEYFKNYLVNKGDRIHVSDLIRNRVQFEEHNLTDPMNRRFQMILCRNVFIYMSENIKKEIMINFENALLDDGILVTGHSEIGTFYSKKLQPVHIQNSTTYYVKRSQPATIKTDPPVALPETPAQNQQTEIAIRKNTLPQKRPAKAQKIENTTEQNIQLRIRDLKERIYIHPEDLEAYYELASLFWETNDRKQARIYQSRARVAFKSNEKLVDTLKNEGKWRLEWEAFLNEDL